MTPSAENEPATVAALEALLADQGKDYLLLTPLPDVAAEVRFIGLLAGRPVLWQMRLSVLEHFRGGADGPAAWPASPRGAMRIEPCAGEVWRAHVALAVPVIDEPVVRKAVIMMRNYKALGPGLRVWGDEGAG